jgi:hypothetical protein
MWLSAEHQVSKKYKPLFVKLLIYKFLLAYCHQAYLQVKRLRSSPKQNFWARIYNAVTCLSLAYSRVKLFEKRSWFLLINASIFNEHSVVANEHLQKCVFEV